MREIVWRTMWTIIQGTICDDDGSKGHQSKGRQSDDTSLKNDSFKDDNIWVGILKVDSVKGCGPCLEASSSRDRGLQNSGTLNFFRSERLGPEHFFRSSTVVSLNIFATPSFSTYEDILAYYPCISLLKYVLKPLAYPCSSFLKYPLH